MNSSAFPAGRVPPSPDIDAVVAALRDLRQEHLARRARAGRPPKLPSRQVLADLVAGISAALFPNRLGPPDLTEDSVDYFVGHTLDSHLRALLVQVKRELLFRSDTTALDDDALHRAHDIVHAFAHGLPDMRRQLETDLQAAYEGDPAAGSVDEVLVCYPGILAIIHHRIAHALHRLGAPLIARLISELAHTATGIDIHPGARIGSSFFIDHGTGVVIGETAVIGQRVRLYQAVTLGAKRFPVDENGQLIKGGARHPVVEDDVVIYAGATILGRVTIGRGAVIGGNVWLTRSVPPGSQVTQARDVEDVLVDAPPVPPCPASAVSTTRETSR